jgi:hypothetical protein
VSAPAQPLAILRNTLCGHIGIVTNPIGRPVLDERRQQLALFGMTDWVVEVREVTDEELLGVLASRNCARCRVA